ncbi:DUF4352 domain-containing protein [Paenarthrobacter nitroguajacolicus]|uniref:DUF4352 domain-containing protein n=1 Tax=Paenarthrobacter nitroguajacolicus TaxID=211146 RepID=A0A558HC67_PAENT|nr:DUF4352 domain-containing protein [Paenarthrobacter nitroguajacolicus]TVU66735.1 DUF4352 domain-containing protein [Paenarthrobacter nitroguajacolicus]
MSALAVITALGLSLSACAAASPSPAATVSVEPLTPNTPSPTASTAKSPRGNFVKEVGSSAGITNKDSDRIVTFTVNSLTPDAPCTGPYPQPVVNGHVVILDVSIETFPELADPNGGYSEFDMNAGMFKFVGTNGTTFNGDLNTQGAYMCLADEESISHNGRGIGPAEKVTGKIALDVPEPHGTLIFRSHLTSGSTGWEWTF